MAQVSDPAFPAPAYPTSWGLSKREYAAILLRVPNSGDPEIDKLIRAANRRDLAAQALQGWRAHPDDNECSAEDLVWYAVNDADALVKELE